MIIVNSKLLNPRIQYTFDFIFGSRNIEFDIQGIQTDLPSTINYGFESGDTIPMANIMGEDIIANQKIDKGDFNGEICLSFNGVVDPIATIFFVLTRYEEYLCDEHDEHGRYKYKSSCLKEYGLIEKAVCDRLAVQICKLVDAEFSINRASIIPTFDIDNTFAYRLKYGMREFASKTRDYLTFRKERLEERKLVKQGNPDPYDTFDQIKTIVEGNENSRIFWLLGDWAKKDRNISADHPDHIALIKEMSEHVKIGIHPSYRSFQNVDMIRMEVDRLSSSVDHKVIDSRQHFLRFTLPKSYECLMDLGIENDYSMGFAEVTGFRAGTARSHYWFNLSTNSQTKLKVHPFVYMDGTLNEYMGLNLEEAKKKIQTLFNEVSLFGGSFVFIWHNETIGGYGKWKGWDEVLNFTLKLK